MVEKNYPIKYAVMQVLEDGGWLYDYEDILIGHIVSKCYLIESKVRYYKDDENRIIHYVLFPYKRIESYKKCGKLLKRSYPVLALSAPALHFLLPVLP